MIDPNLQELLVNVFGAAVLVVSSYVLTVLLLSC